MAKPTILIADDDRVVVELLSLWLTAHGFMTARAADGMQVTMMVRRAPPAVILLDLMMPGGTGFDVLTRLRANAAMKGIPVITMSASADPDLRSKALQSGADAFLHKPLDQGALIATIRDVLAKVQAVSHENE